MCVKDLDFRSQLLRLAADDLLPNSADSATQAGGNGESVCALGGDHYPCLRRGHLSSEVVSSFNCEPLLPP